MRDFIDMMVLILLGVAINILMKIGETNKIAKRSGKSYNLKDYWRDFKWATLTNMTCLGAFGYIFARTGYTQKLIQTIPAFLQLFIYLVVGFAPETFFRRGWLLLGNNVPFGELFSSDGQPYEVEPGKIDSSKP